MCENLSVNTVTEHYTGKDTFLKSCDLWWLSKLSSSSVCQHWDWSHQPPSEHPLSSFPAFLPVICHDLPWLPLGPPLFTSGAAPFCYLGNKFLFIYHFSFMAFILVLRLAPWTCLSSRMSKGWQDKEKWRYWSGRFLRKHTLVESTRRRKGAQSVPLRLGLGKRGGSGTVKAGRWREDQSKGNMTQTVDLSYACLSLEERVWLSLYVVPTLILCLFHLHQPTQMVISMTALHTAQLSVFSWRYLCSALDLLNQCSNGHLPLPPSSCTIWFLLWVRCCQGSSPFRFILSQTKWHFIPPAFFIFASIRM